MKGVFTNRMMCSTKLLYSAIIIALFAYTNLSWGNDTLRLTLSDALSLAMKQAPAMLTARYDSLAAEGNWREVKGKYYPQISYAQDAPEWRESIDEQLVFDPDSPSDSVRYIPSRVHSGDMRWQGRLNVAQDMPWGATVSVSSRIYQRRWYWTEFDERTEFTEYSLLNRVSLDQPLLEGNPVGRKRKIGRIDHDIGRIDYELRLREIRYNTTQGFFNLVSAIGALEISEQDLESGMASEALAKRKLQAGLIPEVELLQIQVDLARREGSYRQTEVALERTRERFNISMGLPLRQFVEVEYDPDPTEVDDNINIDRSAERLETQRQRMNQEKLDMQTRTSILNERVSASLQAYYELDTRRDTFKDLKDKGDRNVGVFLRIDVPLFGFGTTRGRVEALKAAQSRARVDLELRNQELQADLREALRNVELAADRIRISTAAVDLSIRSYSITEERFDNGLIDSRDLLDSQLELTRTRREALNALIDYELALAYLERISPGNRKIR